MREEPPQELLNLVQRLNLATEAQVRGVARQARRLAEGLPLFESVWVDALAHARLLTPFQAAEINAGRGAALQVGPYVLCQRLPSLGYAECYQARVIRTDKLVRLTIVSGEGPEREAMLTPLEALATKADKIAVEPLVPVTAAGLFEGRLWVAGPYAEGLPVADWVVHNGRFPPEAVLEIARQMLAGLVALEKAGLPHGDVSTATVLLRSDGRVILPQPGVRGILRPAEGYAHADLNPDFLTYLPPERIGNGAGATLAGDIYACGAVWWHLLTGRPPIPGGSSLAKLQAIESTRIVDVRRLAPETPGSLAAAVTACLQRSPRMRPESMTRLAAMLGSPTHSGRQLLAECLAHPGRRRTRWTATTAAWRDSGRAPIWIAAIAGCLVAAITLTWSSRQPGPPLPPASIPAPPSAAQASGTPATPRTARTVSREPIDIVLVGRASSPSKSQDGLKAHPTTSVRNPGDPADSTAIVADLVLPGGRPLALESLPLRPGQCVRGDGDNRPLVVVPVTGLLVEAEGVRFQNVDFIWNALQRVPASLGEPAIVQLQASRAEFRGCSFQASQTAPQQPRAIRWTQTGDRTRLELTLPSGQIQLVDCVFRRVEAGISCERLGALSLRAANVLHLGPGPLIRLDHGPRFDEPIHLVLGGVTLRESGPLLECAYRQAAEQPGKIAVQADGCVLAPAPGAALISLLGEGSPEKLLTAIDWTGQGSLITPETPIAQWRRSAGPAETLDESALSMAGVVRSAVSFAGPIEAGPSASRASRWQVPLRSSQPPGVDPRSLVWPER